MALILNKKKYTHENWIMDIQYFRKNLNFEKTYLSVQKKTYFSSPLPFIVLKAFTHLLFTLPVEEVDNFRSLNLINLSSTP